MYLFLCILFILIYTEYIYRYLITLYNASYVRWLKYKYYTSNFDIQSVKSELYIPDTTNNSGNIINVPIGMNEIIKQPLSYEPMNTNIIFEDFTFTPLKI